ncbi:DNA polymerase family A-domain-containing protein [Suillus subluteus]|nr:DNA polymerase family A-domain-containing protein [Suillus subluteus]
MKGLLSLALVSIALLQTIAAVPTASARRGIVIIRTPEIETRDLEGRNYIRYHAYNEKDEGNYLVLVLFLSVILTRSIKRVTQFLTTPKTAGSCLSRPSDSKVQVLQIIKTVRDWSNNYKIPSMRTSSVGIFELSVYQCTWRKSGLNAKRKVRNHSRMLNLVQKPTDVKRGRERERDVTVVRKIAKPVKRNLHELGIQLLPRELHSQIFRDFSFPAPSKAFVRITQKQMIWKCVDWTPNKAQTVLPDAGFTLPPLLGSNIDEHFHRIGRPAWMKHCKSKETQKVCRAEVVEVVMELMCDVEFKHDQEDDEIKRELRRLCADLEQSLLQHAHRLFSILPPDLDFYDPTDDTLQDMRLEGGFVFYKLPHKAGDSEKANMLVWQRGALGLQFKPPEPSDEPRKWGIILPQVITMGTVTRHAIERTWLTASNAKKNRVGSELKAMMRAPMGYVIVGADVDSEELWILSCMRHAQFVIHGATALGWMTLEGTKAAGTDLHSKTASILGISRDQAKVFNYSQTYGAGMASCGHPPSTVQCRYAARSSSTPRRKFARGKNTHRTDLFGRKFWFGGTESFVFNKLEEVALSDQPRTPAFGCGITAALSKELLPANFGPDYMSSRINWVVQSSGVDYLHLLIVAMDHLGWMTYLNWVAFFLAVDIYKVLRKEVNMPCVTPSHAGPILPGEILGIAGIWIRQTALQCYGRWTPYGRTPRLPKRPASITKAMSLLAALLTVLKARLDCEPKLPLSCLKLSILHSRDQDRRSIPGSVTPRVVMKEKSAGVPRHTLPWNWVTASGRRCKQC